MYVCVYTYKYTYINIYMYVYIGIRVQNIGTYTTTRIFNIVNSIAMICTTMLINSYVSSSAAYSMNVPQATGVLKRGLESISCAL